MITDDDVAKAWDRLARTADGGLVYLHLQKILMEVPVDPQHGGGALRANFGRRSLAHELMALMAKGIEDSGGRTDTDGADGRPNQRPVVFVSKQPADVGKRVTARQWLRDNDPEFAAGQPAAGK